jgi:hypothetical protein
VILNWIVKKLVGRVWTGFTWLRIGTCGCGNKSLGALKCGKYWVAEELQYWLLKKGSAPWNWSCIRLCSICRYVCIPAQCLLKLLTLWPFICMHITALTLLKWYWGILWEIVNLFKFWVTFEHMCWTYVYSRFSGFCSAVAEVSILLGHVSVSQGNQSATFWDDIIVSSSRVKRSKKNGKTVGCVNIQGWCNQHSVDS